MVLSVAFMFEMSAYVVGELSLPKIIPASGPFYFPFRALPTANLADSSQWYKLEENVMLILRLKLLTEA